MAKPGPKKGEGGRPVKPLGDDELEKLVAMIRIQCTRDEICGVLDMSDTTLNRRLKERGEVNFEALYKKHCDEGKASLRRQQWAAAQNGNPTMLIWLGKQMLGQTDKVENRITGTMETVNFDAGKLSSGTLKELMDARRSKPDEG